MCYIDQILYIIFRYKDNEPSRAYKRSIGYAALLSSIRRGQNNLPGTKQTLKGRGDSLESFEIQGDAALYLFAFIL
jgi:hypothetical protein